MLLIIDNFDSFTYNLVQYFGELGAEPVVRRNNAITPAEILAGGFTHVVISPGPGTPAESGVSLAAIRELAGKLPMLGVCLGHQSIGEVFGGKVIRATQPIHGKVSRIHHDGKGIFEGIEDNFEAARYHSLIVERESLPAELEISAETADGIIMGLRHRKYGIHGVQFHPESILTANGKRILTNFLASKAIR